MYSGDLFAVWHDEDGDGVCISIFNCVVHLPKDVYAELVKEIKDFAKKEEGHKDSRVGYG